MEDVNKFIKIKKHDFGVLEITLNNPKTKNALNQSLMRYFNQLFDDLANDDTIKALYLTAEGDYFSSGNDINNFNLFPKEELIQFFEVFINKLIDFPKLLIAGVNSTAIGVSFTMLGLFDIIIASDKASFWAPFAPTYQAPEGTSTFKFPQIFGKFAAHILYAGKPITSEDASKYGFITQLIEGDNFNEEALEYVKQCVKLPLKTLMEYKKLITFSEKKILKEVNSKESKALYNSWFTPEFENFKNKFLKQKPKF